MLEALLYLASLLPDAALRAGARALFSRSWRRFEDATQRPRAVQEARLLALVGRAQRTAFGQAHGFAEIRSLADYQARVPIRGWSELEPWIDRLLGGEKAVLTPDEPVFFGRTSGTTGRAKHVPITPVYLAEFRVPRRVWARQLMQAFPGLVRGKFLMVHSPRIEGTTPSGVPMGSITVAYGGAQLGGELKGGPLDCAPRSVFLVEEAALRYHALLRLALQERISVAAAVNPSTLVLLAKKLDALAPILADELEAGTFGRLAELPEPARSEVQARLRAHPARAQRLREAKAAGRLKPTDVWPEMVGLISWTGGSAPFYLGQLAELYPGRSVMDWGFVATEGGFSIPLAPGALGGVAAVTGHVLEFAAESGGEKLPPHAETVLADALEVGRRYRVIITGAHGLYRYDINDVVECVGYHRQTAVIRFVHKGGSMLSLTGEKLGESHVVLAAAAAEKQTGMVLSGFSVSVRLGDPPRYVLAVEPGAEAAEGALLGYLCSFEQGLRAANIEYAAKRDSGRLAAPSLRVLPRGSYEQDRERRVRAGAADSHVKPPHLVRDLEALDQIGTGRELPWPGGQE